MNKTKRKGFTLVELLAVIVILAVVILIAVTAVVPRMNNAKKKAFLDEALVYMKAAKEAYVTDPSTECYNISDMGNLVKQTKEGYSGTVYVNEKGVSLNLTNGKYYIKTTGEPYSSDIVESQPNKFIPTCSTEGTNYTITYDLPSDATVSGTNPSTYNQNTPTITLYNPTRPGYKFLGWSTKNMLQPWVLSTGNGNITFDYSYGSWIVNGQIDSTSYNILIFKKTLPAGSYVINTIPGAANNKFQLVVKKNGSTFKYVAGSNQNFSLTEESEISIQLFVYKTYGNFENLRLDYQLESGTTSTDFQEYMDVSTTAKIYRGSTGNKRFISNWEPL